MKNKLKATSKKEGKMKKDCPNCGFKIDYTKRKKRDIVCPQCGLVVISTRKPKSKASSKKVVERKDEDKSSEKEKGIRKYYPFIIGCIILIIFLILLFVFGFVYFNFRDDYEWLTPVCCCSVTFISLFLIFSEPLLFFKMKRSSKDKGLERQKVGKERVAGKEIQEDSCLQMITKSCSDLVIGGAVIITIAIIIGITAYFCQSSDISIPSFPSDVESSCSTNSDCESYGEANCFGSDLVRCENAECRCCLIFQMGKKKCLTCSSDLDCDANTYCSSKHKVCLWK
jgi:hypothetical protein